MGSKKPRALCIDLLRAVSFCWIVCCLHMSGYPEIGIQQYLPEHLMTHTALASFFLISGLCLAAGTPFHSAGDTVAFYQKRLFRIYPLFILAVMTFLTTPYDLLMRIKTIAGVSSYVGPQISTLWFVSMLVSFYILTPFFCRCRSLFRLLLLSSAWYVAVFILHHFTSGVDSRFFSFFPYYVLGLVLGKTKRNIGLLEGISVANLRKFLTTHKTAAAGLTAVCILVGGFVVFSPVRELWSGFDAEGRLTLEASTLLIITLLLLVGNSRLVKPVAPVIFFLSYVSYTAYLFHRHIFKTLMIASAPLHLSHGGKIFFFAVLGNLIVVFASYLIQRLYDRLLVYLQNRS